VENKKGKNILDIILMSYIEDMNRKAIKIPDTNTVVE